MAGARRQLSYSFLPGPYSESQDVPKPTLILVRESHTPCFVLVAYARATINNAFRHPEHKARRRSGATRALLVEKKKNQHGCTERFVGILYPSFEHQATAVDEPQRVRIFEWVQSQTIVAPPFCRAWPSHHNKIHAPTRKSRHMLGSLGRDDERNHDLVQPAHRTMTKERTTPTPPPLSTLPSNHLSYPATQCAQAYTTHTHTQRQ